MKRIGLIIILSFFTQWLLAQEAPSLAKLSPSLRVFLQDYHNYLFNIIEIDSTDTELLLGKSFFMDTRDTLRWPRLMELDDKMYKSKIGPVNLNNEVDQLIQKYRETHNYLGFNLNNVEIKEVTENKLYTKFKLLVNQQFSFNESENYTNKKAVEKPFYYEIINYFDPENLFLGDGSQSTGYVYRINSITEKLKYGRFSPQLISLNNRVGLLKITENDMFRVENAVNFTTQIEADWLLGGKGYWQFLFKTGIGFGWNSFHMYADQFSTNYSNLNLYDKDDFPFELIISGENIAQKITYNNLILPVILRFERFFKERYSISLFAGTNLQYISSFNLSQTDGSYDFQGKYKFDFFKDPVILSNLPDYNYRNFAFDDPGLSGGTVEVNKFQVSAVAGVEAKYYIARNLSANAGFTYSKSLLPLFENSDKKISFNVLTDPANPGKSDFQPSANPLFVSNDKTMADVIGFNVGISYYLSKPLIPYTHHGLTNNQLTRRIKSQSVLPGMKETGKPVKKEVNFIVNQLRGSSESFRYSYIGPEPEYFQQGKIHSGKQRDNRISVLVPASGNAKIFMEEPYGFELNLGSVPYEELGDFKQIKAVKVSDIWPKDKFYSKSEFTLSELEDYDICLFYYDRMGEDDDNTGLKSITNYIENEIKSERKSIFYVVSSSPFCTDNKEEIGARLFASREIPNDPNIEFLKDYLKEKQLNIRRRINFKIVMPEIGFYKIPRLITQLPEILQIDFNSLKFQVLRYPLGGYVNMDEIQQIMDDLKKNGIIINNL